MNFLKIGNTYVNPERITSIQDLSSKGGPGEPDSHLIRLEFEQGHSLEVVHQYEAVLAWLVENAQSPPDVTP